MSFKNDLRKFADSVEEDVSTVVKGGAFKIFQQLSDRTPRDKGRASAAWNASKNKINKKVPPKGEYPKRSNIELSSEIEKIGKFEEKDTIFLSNNLEYIVPLDRGHSKQAPSGFFRASISAWKQFIRDAAKDVT